jgi:hypothetical protein
MPTRWTLPALLIGALLAAAPAARADAVTIDFKGLGNANTPALAVQDVVLTADTGTLPTNVFMLNLNGLGAVGGSADSMVDGSEALHFDFATLVKGATYTVFVASNLNGNGLVGESTVEAFVGATSLGVVAVNDTGPKNVSALFGGAAITSFTVRANVDGIRIDTLSYATQWTNLGGGLAGSHGVPLLKGSGFMVPGLQIELAATQLLENRLAALIVGYSTVNAPFKGGVLVPAVDLLITGLPTGAGGAINLSAAWPAGVPSGFAFFLQLWLADPAGPAGFAATNAVKGTAP